MGILTDKSMSTYEYVYEYDAVVDSRWGLVVSDPLVPNVVNSFGMGTPELSPIQGRNFVKIIGVAFIG